MENFDISREPMEQRPEEWMESVSPEMMEEYDAEPEDTGCLEPGIGCFGLLFGAVLCGFAGGFLGGILGLFVCDFLCDHLARVSGSPAFLDMDVPWAGFGLGMVIGIVVGAILGGLGCRKLALWLTGFPRPEISPGPADGAMENRNE